MPIAPAGRRAQVQELAVLLVLYLLQISNAEMLRRAAGLIGTGSGGSEKARMVAGWSFALANHVHPVAMPIFGIWLAVSAVVLARGEHLPRWSLDGPGLWFCLRMLAEFLTINGLIFEGSTVPPGVLLGQIVLYLPFFVITWGWIFQRLDWIDQREPGRVIQLCDADSSKGVSRFDYFHSSITTLLNKGKPTIVGVSRSGRILVLMYLSMVLGLYAVTFTRILQLTRSAI